MIFTLLTFAIVVITVLFLLLPLFSKKEQQNSIGRDAVNIESAVARLTELKLELKNNLITEEQFQHYQLELEVATLEDLENRTSIETQKRKGNKVLAITIALTIPAFSISIYQQLGSEAAFDVQLQTDGSAIASREIEKMLLVVEKSVQENPDDVEGKITLAQVYVELERYSDAANVYRELTRLLPDDPDALVNYAEALARSHGNRLTGKPAELLNTALTLAPDHGRALWLAGFAKQQADNTAGAIAHWHHLLAGMEEGSEAQKRLNDLIAELERNETTSTTVVTTDKPTNEKQSLQVKVSLLPELQTKIDPDTVMFIYVRAVKGSPMPLAVHRGLAKDLPITVTLDDSMAMMPQISLSSFPKVIVGARLSSNGQPQGQAGDYEGFSDVIEVLTNPVVDILIDSTKP